MAPVSLEVVAAAVVQSTGSVIVLVLLGVAATFRGVFDSKGVSDLGKLVYHISLPALLFTKTLEEICVSRLRQLWVLPAFNVLHVVLAYVFTTIACRVLRLDAVESRTAVACVMFGNVGALAIAVMQALCAHDPLAGAVGGKEQCSTHAVSYIGIYLIAQNILMFSWGERLLVGRGTMVNTLQEKESQPAVHSLDEPLLEGEQEPKPPIDEGGGVADPAQSSTTDLSVPVNDDDDSVVFAVMPLDVPLGICGGILQRKTSESNLRLPDEPPSPCSSQHSGAVFGTAAAAATSSRLPVSISATSLPRSSFRRVGASGHVFAVGGEANAGSRARSSFDGSVRSIREFLPSEVPPPTTNASAAGGEEQQRRQLSAIRTSTRSIPSASEVAALHRAKWRLTMDACKEVSSRLALDSKPWGYEHHYSEREAEFEARERRAQSESDVLVVDAQRHGPTATGGTEQAAEGESPSSASLSLPRRMMSSIRRKSAYAYCAVATKVATWAFETKRIVRHLMVWHGPFSTSGDCKQRNNSHRNATSPLTNYDDHQGNPPLQAAGLALVLGLVPQTKALFIESRDEDPSMPPPVLSFVLSATSTLGDAQVPVSMLMLSGSGTLRYLDKLKERAAIDAAIEEEEAAGNSGDTPPNHQPSIVVTKPATFHFSIKAVAVMIVGRVVCMPIIGYALWYAFELLGWFPSGDKRDMLLSIVVLVEAAVPSAQNVIMLLLVHGELQQGQAMAEILLLQYLVCVPCFTAAVTLFEMVALSGGAAP